MGFTAAAIVGETILDAGVVAAADATAAGLGFSSAAEAIGAGVVDAATLGLPEATTIADLGAVEGSASAGFVSSGAAPGIAGGVGADLGTMGGAVSPAVAKTPEVLASQLGFSDPIAAIAGGVNPADLGMVQSGAGGLADLAGYAKTGAQLIGGIGQLTGGIAGMQRSGQLQGRADPMGAYRPGYAAQLQNLMQDPSTITSTPGYQFNLANYMQALQAKQAKEGSLVGGGALVQAGQMGQQYATSQLKDQQLLLAQLAGAGQSPAYGTQTASNVSGMGAKETFAGLGNVLDPLATLYTKYNQPSPSVA